MEIFDNNNANAGENKNMGIVEEAEIIETKLDHTLSDLTEYELLQMSQEELDDLVKQVEAA